MFEVKWSHGTVAHLRPWGIGRWRPGLCRKLDGWIAQRHRLAEDFLKIFQDRISSGDVASTRWYDEPGKPGEMRRTLWLPQIKWKITKTTKWNESCQSLWDMIVSQCFRKVRRTTTTKTTTTGGGGGSGGGGGGRGGWGRGRGRGWGRGRGGGWGWGGGRGWGGGQGWGRGRGWGWGGGRCGCCGCGCSCCGYCCGGCGCGGCCGCWWWWWFKSFEAAKQLQSEVRPCGSIQHRRC